MNDGTTNGGCRVEGIELVTASNRDDVRRAHRLVFFKTYYLFYLLMYIYLLSMTPQHAAMEGTANWAQMTWTSFRLRYVFFYIYSFKYIYLL